MSDPTSPLRSGAAGVVLPPQPQPGRTLTMVERRGPIIADVTFKASPPVDFRSQVPGRGGR